MQSLLGTFFWTSKTGCQNNGLLRGLSLGPWGTGHMSVLSWCWLTRIDLSVVCVFVVTHDHVFDLSCHFLFIYKLCPIFPYHYSFWGLEAYHWTYFWQWLIRKYSISLHCFACWTVIWTCPKMVQLYGLYFPKLVFCFYCVSVGKESTQNVAGKHLAV